MLLVNLIISKLDQTLVVYGGFQLEFVSISRVINLMTCYNLSPLIGGKSIFSKKPLQDLLSSLNVVILTNDSTQIYNMSCDLSLGLYLQILTENHL